VASTAGGRRSIQRLGPIDRAAWRNLKVAKRKALTKAQLGRMRVDLEERKKWLIQEFRDRLGVAEGNDNPMAGDDADRAASATNLEYSLGIAARESREIQLIEDALQKIDSNSYGICEECGEAMAPGRLEALPFAVYCIDCQERIEEEEEQGILSGRLPQAG
jgi:DnaK suppressor protein